MDKIWITSKANQSLHSHLGPEVLDRLSGCHRDHSAVLPPKRTEARNDRTTSSHILELLSSNVIFFISDALYNSVQHPSMIYVNGRIQLADANI